MRRAVLDLLLSAPATQKEIREELGLNSGTLSKIMGELTAAGLVSRDKSHGPYELTFRKRTWAILQAASDLGEEISSAQAQVDAEHNRERRKRGMQGPGTTQHSTLRLNDRGA